MTFSASSSPTGVNDGKNDVGWASLGGTTLGVTWFTVSAPEADMALNSRFACKSTCGSGGGSDYDVETVFLHARGARCSITTSAPSRTCTRSCPRWRGWWPVRPSCEDWADATATCE